MALTDCSILKDGAALKLTWDDTTEARFHAIWLRDNALDPETRDPGNGQRLISLADIETGISIAQAHTSEDGLAVTFSSGHRSTFPADWLRHHIYDRATSEGVWASDVELWKAGHDVHVADLSALQSDPATLRDWLAAVRKYGVARVSGLAKTSGSLENVVNLFGYIRETNYGRWFEVRSEINPTNLAYTNLGLQAHTDNPYRDPVPGLQILSCLENTVAGGESSVVDGFAAAEQLRQEDPSGFELLSRYPARFEYAGSQGVRLIAKRPILERGPDGEVLSIRFNNRSMAAVTDIPFEDMADWYAALRRLGEIIDSADSAVTFRLDPGEAFIVDNTRVLHARSSFSSGGTRWLQGCYADRDGLLSTLSALEPA